MQTNENGRWLPPKWEKAMMYERNWRHDSSKNQSWEKIGLGKVLSNNEDTNFAQAYLFATYLFLVSSKVKLKN
ncbi:hypothetical protein BLOT_002927 [Blomia tropicalis]|nr:hypothetical protein BLOT_002927 [Blomia tropicalis]